MPARLDRTRLSRIDVASRLTPGAAAAISSPTTPTSALSTIRLATSWLWISALLSPTISLKPLCQIEVISGGRGQEGLG